MGSLNLVIKKIQIVEIFKRFKQASPHPTTELKYPSGFEFLKDNWGACFIVGGDIIEFCVQAV